MRRGRLVLKDLCFFHKTHSLLVNARSVGVVIHEDVHDATNIAGLEATLAFIAKHEPVLAADPDDNEARFQLALRKVVGKDYDDGMELLLELMQKDRSYEDDAGRNTLLKVFELLGDDPRVSRYRSRMANLLY